MLMFGILASAAAGGAAGFLAGTTLGKTRPATPLPTTIKLTREQLASAVTELERAGDELNADAKSEHAGRAMVLTRRLQELTTSLGRIGHKAKQEGSA
jgi:hypothetical protein